MVPLSDVVRAARLDGAAISWRPGFVVGGGGAGRAALAARVPEAEHLISFHIFAEGQCWCGLNGEA